jgi:protein TonB
LLLPTGEGPSKSSGVVSLMVHGLAIVALLSLGGKVAPLVPHADRTPIYIPSLKDMMPLIQSNHGGGGGGDGSPIPASIGRAPRFQLEQIVPPSAVIRTIDPKLEVEPSLEGPPDLKLPSPDLSVWGDPNGKPGSPSNGPGRGNGIGTGEGTGIGPGKGPGYGPGENGGFGNATFHPVGGATAPIPIFRVEPEFTDAARKAKYQGTVEVTIIVDADGTVRDPHVVKAVGLGLDERALEAVKQWKFKPGMKDGHAVPVYAKIDVTFRLL